ncbi:uncharacterized protein G2W53_042556 [Senna tora]|uniref:Retrotransposon Copia-like N-terminal domain-containing protein n=1 Tax=Senna tora TaxID=362788 RepID=A0A834SJ24_9FABA|nr:uncharacterized protein G2W53_042556 [Senna tora]
MSSSSSISDVSSTTVPKTYSLFNSSSQTSSVKLDRRNYLFWEAVVLPMIKGNHLSSHIDGTGAAPPRLVNNGTDDPSANVATRGDSDSGKNNGNNLNQTPWRGSRGGSRGRGGRQRGGRQGGNNNNGFLNKRGSLAAHDCVVPLSLQMPFLVEKCQTQQLTSATNSKASTDSSSCTRTKSNNGATDKSAVGGASCARTPAASESAASSSRSSHNQSSPLSRLGHFNLENEALAEDGPNTSAHDALTTEACVTDAARDDGDTSQHQTQHPTQHPMLTRSRAGVHKPKTPYIGLAMTAQEVAATEPQSIRKYVMDVLKRFNMSECATVSTLMVTGRKFSCNDGEIMTDPSLY